MLKKYLQKITSLSALTFYMLTSTPMFAVNTPSNSPSPSRPNSPHNPTSTSSSTSSSQYLTEEYIDPHYFEYRIPGVQIYRYKGKPLSTNFDDTNKYFGKILGLINRIEIPTPTYYGYIIEDSDEFKVWCFTNGISEDEINILFKCQNIWFYVTPRPNHWDIQSLPNVFSRKLLSIKELFTKLGYVNPEQFEKMVINVSEEDISDNQWVIDYSKIDSRHIDILKDCNTLSQWLERC